MCNMKICFREGIKKIKDKNLFYILTYWIFTSSIFIYGFWNNGALKDFLKADIFFYNIVVILCFFISILFIPLKYVNLLPSINLFCILYLLNTRCKDFFYSFTIYNSLIPIIGNILLFNFILYNEKIEKSSINKLSYVHARYLEYFKTYIWAVIFGVLGYYTWQLNKSQAKFALESEEIRKALISVMNYTNSYPLSRSLLQMGVSAFSGIILISHAFHVKLKEIEKAMP